MEQLPELRKKILSFPEAPGVYLMRDSLRRVLYVGKANSLKKRLLNYLGPDLPSKTQALMAKVADVEFRLAPNEAMALLLEFKLIHEFNPQYNISLKDDKSYPLVSIWQEEFPVIQITRKKNRPGAKYLGPYTNSKLLKNALVIIRRYFPYRSCLRLPKQSCIYHKINLCPAPCIGRINSHDYRQIIDNVILILEGKQDLLMRKLARSMQEKSAAGDFEAAARIRDQINILSKMSGPPDQANYKNELELLKASLNLKTLPVRIEGFDISNLAGKQAVGSMVSFYNGQPDKNNYRRFRIKSFSGIDDYKMLAEVVRRRYTRLLAEQKALPDLLLIDGGRGHILTAAQELEALNLHIPLVSIAKEKENIYSVQPGVHSAVLLRKKTALNLIRRIRDEAHRFALGYHHLLRKKAFIPG
ncbi:MAG TPA: excinuclease ABC subunit UvrC [Candidatus Omnitrophota bacterium]|nr:excinuclease ABC subunit UvrC [Candidatus Omnitrophota bacterium]HPT38784.1 excinuclease ABC subunit UvrC [Candidatus Omnitrophota bacterium]